MMLSPNEIPIIECSICGVELDDAVMEAYDLTTKPNDGWEELLCGRCLEDRVDWDDPVLWRDHNWDIPY